MKAFSLIFSLLLLCSCTCLHNSNHTETQTDKGKAPYPVPKFAYGDNLVVTKGFLKGCSGKAYYSDVANAAGYGIQNFYYIAGNCKGDKVPLVVGELWLALAPPETQSK
jgi:hypothetical protein